MSNEKPTCAVRGMIQRGAMCGYVIVGGKYCGYSGDCQHKVATAERTPLPVAAAPDNQQEKK